MSTKTEAEKPTLRRSSRRTANDGIPASGTGSILFASALQSETRKQKAGGRGRTATRQVAQPEFLTRLGSTQPFGLLGRMFSWFRSRVGSADSRELRLAETVQLGDKRFVAIIHVEGRKFLIGGGTGGVNLLTQLDEPAA
jgi:hypothetical protein